MSYMGKKNTLVKTIHSKHIPCRSFRTEQQVTQEEPFETLILHKLTNTRAHTHTHTHTHQPFIVTSSVLYIHINKYKCQSR